MLVMITLDKHTVRQIVCVIYWKIMKTSIFVKYVNMTFFFYSCDSML